jgi:hypothetical protein
MILALIPDIIKLPAAIALGAALSFYPVKWYGQSEGKQMAATASLVKSVEILRDRNTIDAEVSSSDATAMCAAFFVPDSEEHGECMRRLAAANADARNGGQDHNGRPAVCQPGSKP